jgi:hypothetical protein
MPGVFSNRACILVLGLFLPQFLYCQTWEWMNQAVKGNGNNYVQALCSDGFDNLYITGRNKGTGTYGTGTGGTALPAFGDRDIYLSKYAQDGTFLWAKRYGGLYSDYGYGVSTDSIGNAYVTGHFTTSAAIGALGTFTSFGSSDIYLMKHSPSGTPLWFKKFGGDQIESGYAIKTSKSGVSVISGEFSDTANFDMQQVISKGLTDVFIAKFDNNGNVLWVKSFGGTSDDASFGVFQDDQGNVYATGSFTGTVNFGGVVLSSASAGNSDIFTLKMDPNGNVLWAKAKGSGVADEGRAINVDQDGNVLVTGNWAQTNIIVLKYDPLGNQIWQVIQGSPGYDVGYGITSDTLGNVYVDGDFAGNISFGSIVMTCSGTQDFFVECLNSSGMVQWAKKSGGPADEHAFGSDITSKNDIYVGGGFQGTVNFDGFTRIACCGTFDACGGKLIQPVIANFTHSLSTICQGSAVSFFDNSAGFPTSWAWSFPGGTPSTSLAANPVVTYASAGTYDVQLIVTHGPLAIDTIFMPGLVNVIYTPVTINVADSIICPGDTATLTANPGFLSLLWSNGSSASSLAVTTPGYYYIAATDVSGCLSYDTVGISLHSVTNVSAGPNVFVCSTVNFPVVLIASSGYASYAWSTGDATNSTNANTIGTFNVTAIDSNGCSSSDSLLVNYYSTNSVNLASDTVICYAQSIILFSTSTYPSYIWSTGDTTSTLLVNTPGMYTLNVTDTNGCPFSDSVLIGIENFVDLFTFTDTSTCTGNTILFDAGFGYPSYVWSDGSTAQTLITMTPGQYWVNVTSINGCVVSDSINLLNYPSPPQIFTFNDTTVCNGTNVLFDAGPGFASYSWSDASTFQTFNTNVQGLYWVEVITSNGCEVSDTVNLFTLANPSPFLGSDTLICSDDMIILNAGIFNSYLWSSGATSTSIIIDTAGFYWITVSDINGCSGTDTVLVTEQNCTGVYKPVTSSIKLNVFPNPANDELNIAFNASITGFTYTVCNSMGQLLSTNEIYGSSVKLNTKSYESGIYVLVVTTGNETFIERIAIR